VKVSRRNSAERERGSLCEKGKKISKEKGGERAIVYRRAGELHFHEVCQGYLKSRLKKKKRVIILGGPNLESGKDESGATKGVRPFTQIERNDRHCGVKIVSEKGPNSGEFLSQKGRASTRKIAPSLSEKGESAILMK